MKSAATDERQVDPRHSVRATRTAGRQMRSRLLDAASRLFREKGPAGVSIADIAEAADAFPSQITYYFRTKEALFVEAACRDVLYVGRAAEQHAGKQLARQVTLRHQQPVVARVFDESSAGFHQTLLQAGSRPLPRSARAARAVECQRSRTTCGLCGSLDRICIG